MLSINPGLMVWTAITFGIAVFVLWRYAFGPLEKVIERAPGAHRREPRDRRRDARRSSAAAR